MYLTFTALDATGDLVEVFALGVRSIDLTGVDDLTTAITIVHIDGDVDRLHLEWTKDDVRIWAGANPIGSYRAMRIQVAAPLGPLIGKAEFRKRMA